MNLLNIVTFFTLNVVLGYHHTRLTTILIILKSKLSISILTETRILLSQLSVDFQNIISLNLFIIIFGHYSITRLKLMARKELMEGFTENIPGFEQICPIYILTKTTKITKGTTTDVSIFPLGSFFRWNFPFSMLKASVYLPQILCLYSTTSYPFGLPSRSKRPPFGILK